MVEKKVNSWEQAVPGYNVKIKPAYLLMLTPAGGKGNLFLKDQDCLLPLFVQAVLQYEIYRVWQAKLAERPPTNERGVVGLRNMVNSIVEPRKQRTRQHVIADLGVHYVEGFILEKGHAVRKLDSDYSYDLIMRTFDERGYVEPGPVYFQVKSSEALRPVGSDFFFDIDIRDYHLWMREELPVVLVLFDASRKKAYWLSVQQFFDKNVAVGKIRDLRFALKKRGSL